MATPVPPKDPNKKKKEKKKKTPHPHEPEPPIDKSKPPLEILDSAFDATKGLQYHVRWTDDETSTQWEPKEAVLPFKQLLHRFHHDHPTRPRFVQVDVDQAVRPARISDSRQKRDGALEYYAWWHVLIDEAVHVRGSWVAAATLAHCGDMTAAFHRKYPARAPGELCYTCLGLDCGFQELLMLKDPEAEGLYLTSGSDGFSADTDVMSMGFGLYGCDLVQSVGETGCGGCALLLDAVKVFKRPWMDFDAVNFKLELLLYDGQTLTVFVSPTDEPDISESTAKIVALQLYTLPDVYCPWPSIGSRIGTKISLHESPMSYGTARNVSQTPDDDITFGLIQQWYESCRRNHARCNSRDDVSMPSRLIYISGQKGKISIRDTNGASFDYTALSHCWGLSLHLRAMVATIDKMKEEIPWESLPRTYQDAITIGRKLGIDYIWIDSLCILQDSVHDWEVESAKMGRVYRNAALVVAASSGIDGDQGCFRNRAYSEKLHPVQNGKTYTVMVRELLEHTYFGLGLSENVKSARNDKLIQSNPLFQRAWTLQERYLATRTIHFTDAEMVWECQEGASCECGAMEDFSGDRLLESLRTVKQNSSNIDQNSLQEVWRDLIPLYSRRNLTVQTDALPALSGLAETFVSASKDDYVAGMWLHDLHRSLLWYSMRTDNERRKDYAGPSWSWCCIRGPIEIVRPLTGGIDHRSDIISAKCEVQGANPFGKISTASLVIRGSLHDAALCTVLWGSPSLYQGQTTVWLSLPGGTHGPKCLAVVDDEADVKTWKVGKELTLFVILLDKPSGGQVGGGLHRALLLERQEKNFESFTFRRVGLVIQGNQEAWDWDGGRIEEITII